MWLDIILVELQSYSLAVPTRNSSILDSSQRGLRGKFRGWGRPGAGRGRRGPLCRMQLRRGGRRCLAA